MSKAYDFLKQCGSFFVLTINGDSPAGRPFGAVMEVDGDLYLATNNFNQAHKQMRANPNVQIVAQKPNSREWIRITGLATECHDQNLTAQMFAECPILSRHYPNGPTEHFLMFKVHPTSVELK